MAYPSFLLLLLLLLLLLSTASSSNHNNNLSVVDDDDQSYTHLHFYMQHNVSGPDPSSRKIVTDPTDPSLWTFGVVAAFDDALTEGLDPGSSPVGRAQGLYFHVSRTGLGIMWTSNFVFTEGDYAGSTLAVLASEDMLAPVKELPVVGGTGRFRMARGYALMVDHWISLGRGDAVLELDVYVLKERESRPHVLRAVQ